MGHVAAKSWDRNTNSWWLDGDVVGKEASLQWPGHFCWPELKASLASPDLIHIPGNVAESRVWSQCHGLWGDARRSCSIRSLQTAPAPAPLIPFLPPPRNTPFPFFLHSNESKNHKPKLNSRCCFKIRLIETIQGGFKASCATYAKEIG